MKIYNPIAPFVIRVNIRKQGHTTAHITFCDTTSEELMQKLKEIVEPHLKDPFVGGKKTAIDLRESLESKNGKSTSFSFMGLDPYEVKKIIWEHFKNITL